MKALLYKELKLSINKFFYILPFVLALLFFIPQWIFSLVFMYFFWISVSQIYSSYTAQRDYAFMAMLPVKKKDIVSSKVYAFFIVEGLHMGFGIIFAIANNLIYGSYNFFMDINLAFFGIAFVTFGIFNIIFLPLYFKTAYRFGKPVIYGTTATLLFAGFFEFASIKIPFIYNITESTEVITQLLVLISGLIISVSLNYIALRKSITNFEQIN